MTVDEYLSLSPEPQQSTLRTLREMLLAIVPDPTDAISYGVPAVLYRGRPVAGYAHAKRHCSYFPHSGSVIPQVDPLLLAGYDWSKGTLRFQVDQPLPEELVRALIHVKLEMLRAEE